MPGLFRGRGLSPLGTDQGEFARIQPVATAVRALVHFNPALGAKEVPMELYPCASGTFTLAGLVHNQALVPSNVQQGLPHALTLFIYFLQLEGIKPNSAAAALAGIHGDTADLQLGQLIKTGRAFHSVLCASASGQDGTPRCTERLFVEQECLCAIQVIGVYQVNAIGHHFAPEDGPVWGAPEADTSA